MFHSGKHRSMLLLSTVLAFCILLTSCGNVPFLDRLFGGASYDIRNTVSDYLDQISNGLYANLDYDYFSVKDTKFAELAFTNDDAAEVMDEGMTKMSYEIGKITGSTRDLTGSCEVMITAVDIEEVLSDFDDADVQKDALIDAILDSDVPTLKTKIILSLSYDPSTKFWSVADTAPLVKILGDPYTKIVFQPDEDSPAALVATFLTALAERDEKKALETVPIIDSTRMGFDDSIVDPLLDEYYSRFTFEYIETNKVSGGDTEVTYKISRPDFETAAASQMEDIEFQASIIKSHLLMSIKEEVSLYTDKDMTILISDLVERVADAPCITEDVIFTLQPDAQDENWILRFVPEELYNITFDKLPSNLIYSEGAVLALDQLLSEGSINQAVYDDYVDFYNDAIVPLKNAEAKGYSYEASWKIPSGDYIFDTFDAKTTTGIEYWLFFEQGIPEDTNFVYEWYNQSGSVLYATTTDSVLKGDNRSWSSLLPAAYGELLPPDVYRLIIKINDGTAIADDLVFVE